MTGVRRRRIVVGAFVALSLPGALADCSDSVSGAGSSSSAAAPAMTGYPSPSTTATSTSTTATASASSAPAPAVVEKPVLPDEAKAHTPDGAAAFARYYMDLINYAWQKPDPAPLRHHSSPECKTCAAMADQAAQYAAENSRLDRDATIVRSSDPGATLSNGKQLVVVTASQQPYRLITSRGISKPQSASRIVSEFAVEWTAAGWRTTAISLPL